MESDILLGFFLYNFTKFGKYFAQELYKNCRVTVGFVKFCALKATLHTRRVDEL
jgi:hypothetical protein